MKIQKLKGFVWIGNRVNWNENTIDFRIWRDCLEFCVSGRMKAEILSGTENLEIRYNSRKVGIWNNFLKERKEKQ
jgi:hypothetical protein